MKKTALLITSVITMLVLCAGIFSAGLLIGSFVIPKWTETSQSLFDLPVITNTEESTEQSDAQLPTPEDEEGNAITDFLEQLKTETTEPGDEEIVEGDPTLTPPASTGVDMEVPPPAENLEELFVPFWETWTIVHEYYVSQPVDDEAMMQGAIQGMIAAMQVPTATLNVEIPGVGAYTGQGGTPEGLETLFNPFWTNWALTQTITDEQLVEGAIIGMLDSLGDPHTSYMNPKDYKEATTTFEGEEEYEGIGAWVDVSKDYLTIITPFPDSPAEKAGLMPGDKILAIDGEDMTGLDGELVRQKVLGPAGTTITLSILRNGLEPFDVDVTRGRVVVPSVEARMLDNNIAYLRLFLFGDKSDEEVRDALQQLLAEKPAGLIFDLRYNGGGSVDTAVAIASEFIDQGVIFYEIYGDGEKDTYEANGRGLAADIPMVVLVNEGSASASEIVAGAIQDYSRAPLVGTRTFGKGSVQYWIPLSDDKGAVRVTIASWVTPKERQIHQQGLEPDIPIIGIPQSLLDEGFDLSILEMDPENIIILSDEEVQQSTDVQLDKAIEILLEQIQ